MRSIETNAEGGAEQESNRSFEAHGNETPPSRGKVISPNTVGTGASQPYRVRFVPMSDTPVYGISPGDPEQKTIVTADTLDECAFTPPSEGQQISDGGAISPIEPPADGPDASEEIPNPQSPKEKSHVLADEPTRIQNIMQLSDAIGDIFSSDEPADIEEVQETYGVSLLDVKVVAGAYVDAVVVSAQTPEQAKTTLEALYLPYGHTLEKGLLGDDQETVRALRRNPFYTVLVERRNKIQNDQQEHEQEQEGTTRHNPKSMARKSDLEELLGADSGVTNARIKKKFGGMSAPTIRKYVRNILTQRVAALREAGVVDPHTGERGDPGMEGALRILQEPFLQGTADQQAARMRHPMNTAIRNALHNGSIAEKGPEAVNDGLDYSLESITKVLALWEEHSIKDIARATGLQRSTVRTIVVQLRANGIDLPEKNAKMERSGHDHELRLAEVQRLYGTMSNAKIAKKLRIKVGTVSRLVAGLREEGIDLRGEKQRNIQKKILARPDEPINTVASDLSISPLAVARMRDEEHLTSDASRTPEVRDRIDKEIQLYRFGLRSHQIAALLNLSHPQTRSDLTRMPQAIKKDLGIGPGRRKEVEVDWMGVAQTMASFGISSDEASERLGIPLPEVAIDRESGGQQGAIDIFVADEHKEEAN